MPGLGVSVLALAIGAPGGAFAQVPLPHRPNETRPPIPDFRPPPVARGQILPPVETPDDRWSSRAGGATIEVTEYRFVGNSLVSDAELAAIARSYTNRAVTLPELKALRDLLTLAYVDRGFVASGVILPDQAVVGGVVEFHAVEGELRDVDVTTDGRFRVGYLDRRISRPLRGHAANISRIEDELQLLLEDERIESVTAALVPDDQRGDALLNVRIQEAPAFYGGFTAINDLAPAIGGLAGRALIGHRNLFGIGDHAFGGVGYGEGFRELALGYTIPLNAAQTLLEMSYLENESQIVDSSLEALDIESESQSIGVGVTHRVAHTLTQHLDLSLRLDYRRSEGRLLGRGFSFVPGPDEGIARLAVARLRQDWTYRSVNNVLALWSTLSVGLDALDATRNEGDTPDGQFVAWLVQTQWAHRMAPLDSQLVARADLQLANNPLLGLEQFTIGGIHTVRGYRQNAVVRDNGVIVSAEWRVPVWRSPSGHSLTLTPFFDAGHGWNAPNHPGSAETLAGVGVGVGWQYRGILRAQVYLAEALKDVATFGETSLQDDGVYVSFGVGWP